MLKIICYVSSSQSNLDLNDLNKLFNTSKKNNNRLNISGILIHQNGNFLQILEGEGQHVDSLYQKIRSDYRHYNTIPIINYKICDRIFENYDTGYLIVNNSKDLYRLRLYLNWLKTAELDKVNKLIKVVENFIGVKVLIRL